MSFAIYTNVYNASEMLITNGIQSIMRYAVNMDNFRTYKK